jgi:hypothetical protein
MNKFIAILITVIILLPSSVLASCNKTYEIHYLPLSAEFFIPPSRKLILKAGKHFTVTSCEAEGIFKVLNKTEIDKAQKYDMKRLRVLVIEPNKHKEFFITAEKEIIYKGRQITVDTELVKKVIEQIKEKVGVDRQVNNPKDLIPVIPVQ